MRIAAVLSVALGVSLFTQSQVAIAQPRPARPPVAVQVLPAPATLTQDAVVQRQDVVYARLKPEAARQLEAAAREYIARVERVPTPGRAPKGPMDHAKDVAATVQNGALGADIEAMALLIMAQAARDAEADLKAMLAEMKQANRTKEELRKHFEYLRAKRAGLFPEKPAGLDAMNELTESQSLRLQMAMDRISKMMATLSNILKKIADTQQTIVQNMK